MRLTFINARAASIKKEGCHMPGWIAASATAIALGAVGAGTFVSGQSEKWDSDAQEAQVARVFHTGGARIGVSIRDFNEDELKAGKATTGVVIDDVEADSPAQKAGFKAGDIVLEFDGERVRSTRQFTRLVQETVAGRSVTAAVTRDGQRLTLNVQPRAGGSLRFFDGSGDFSFAMPAPKVGPPMLMKRDFLPPNFESLVGGSGQLGISVDELSPQLSEYFGTKEGVLVTTVHDASNASKVGLKAGDVITSLNGGAVTSAADLRRRAQRLEGGDEFTLGIVRDRKPMTLKGKVEPAQPARSSARVVV
jgi:serine protease Do